MGSRQRLRKKASPQPSTSAALSMRDTTSEKKRAVGLKARISIPSPSRSIGLQNVRCQRPRKIPRQPIDGRRVLLKKAGQIARQLILIVKKIGWVFKKHLALTIGQRDLYA